MPPTPEQIATALSLPFDRAQMRRIVSDLAALGSAPSGFRVTGTPEDRAAARLAAAEMRAIGLQDVSVETVPVYGWRMRSASLDVGGRSFECASMGGVPGTPPGGITAPLVWAGDASRRRLDRIDVGGRIAVVEWRSGSIWPSDVGLELAARGAIGVVVHCPQGGPYYQSPRALGAFNSRWYAGAPPMVTIRKEDAVTRPQADGRRPRRREADAARGRRAVPGVERGRVPAGTAAGRADRGRRPPRRLVPGRVRQRQRRCRDAGNGPGDDGGRRAARAHDLLHVANGRGVRPGRQRVRLVHGRARADRTLAPGVGRAAVRSICASRHPATPGCRCWWRRRPS